MKACTHITLPGTLETDLESLNMSPLVQPIVSMFNIGQSMRSKPTFGPSALNRPWLIDSQNSCDVGDVAQEVEQSSGSRRVAGSIPP